VSYLLSEKNIEKGTYYIRISTKFADFIKLGHYGCDAGSCFDDNATSYYKYNLAKANNTFVVLVSKSKEAFDNGTFSARGWGFYLPKNRTINICNIYHKGLQTETIKQIIKEVISTILDKDDIIVTDSKITVTSAIYHNQTPNWTFSDKTIKTRQRLSSDRKIQMHYRDLKHPRWPY
jgi:predicted nucleic-acid-binding protein